MKKPNLSIYGNNSYDLKEILIQGIPSRLFVSALKYQRLLALQLNILFVCISVGSSPWLCIPHLQMPLVGLELCACVLVFSSFCFRLRAACLSRLWLSPVTHNECDYSEARPGMSRHPHMVPKKLKICWPQAYYFGLANWQRSIGGTAEQFLLITRGAAIWTWL